MQVSKIYIAQSALDSHDTSEIVYSNIDLLNELFNELVYEHEAHTAALQSYYVDYYLAQVNNGGFAQFVYNSQANRKLYEQVAQGLSNMGAVQHLALFQRNLGSLKSLSETEFEDYLADDYFSDEDPVCNTLNQHNDAFYALQQQEDLTEYNANWLKHHPDLHPIANDEQWQQILHSIIAQIPNLAERQAEQENNRPRYVKIISALCQQNGNELVSINAADYIQYQGKRHFACYFNTEQGTRYMLDFGDQAAMFDYDSEEEIIRIDVSHIAQDKE